MKSIIKKAVFTGIGMELNSKGFGLNKHPFSDEHMESVAINVNLKDKLIYPDVKILSDDIKYIFTKNNSTLFQGHIDSEGTNETIENDIEQMPEYINLIMALVSKDKQKINQYSKEDGFLTKAMGQAKDGIKKGKQNNHY
jgi:hypothetical protein